MTTIQAHSSNYTKGRTKKIDHIVLHYTAGDGDTAENNGKYFQSTDRNASAHYFVDEDSVVRSVADGDTAWHAGNWDMNCRSVGVEMCSKKDAAGNYYIPERTINHAQFLVKTLMKQYGVTLQNVIRHYDVTKKRCPAPLVEEAAWKAFKNGLTDKSPEPAAAWAEYAWQAAAQKGVCDGTRPLEPVTRQELAVILQRMKLI